ncbi:MAG: trypsin-like serine protease, partial [Pseudonocardiaceae bacterium]|nr:trypsin-like serine protease [Pseudonocardiaceae bacterium]
MSGPPTKGSNAQAPAGGVAEVAKKVLPRVVSISTQGGTAEGEGSGVVISSSGRILTNNHVVVSAKQGGDVTVTFHGGKRATAEVVGTDPSSDLAVIEASGVSGLQPASLGDSDALQVGAPVVAIGSPLGLSGTVTSGIVSAVNRPVRTGGSGGNPFGGEQQSAVID